MNERLKELRKQIGLTQQQFADRIGIKRNTIANYEIGRNVPVDSIIVLICREFNVNENWLRNGTGEMFLPDACDELEALAKKYNYTAAIAVAIEKVVNMSEEQQAVITDFLIEFAAGIQSMKDAGIDPKGKAFPRGGAADLSIDEKVEAYRRALEEEAAGGKGEESEVC